MAVDSQKLNIWAVIGLFLLGVVLAAQGQSLAELDDCFTITVGGQTVQVNPDGTFEVPNVSAPDTFGPEGPGSAPDGVSDDFVRVVGVCTKDDGTTLYAYSGFFQITQNGTIDPGPITITDIPPIQPVSMSMSVADLTLTEDGQQTQVTVSARIGDGSTIDVTPASTWTSYRVSNPQMATVSPDGIVIGADPLIAGTVIVTAMNEGVTATVRILMAPGDPLTSLEGLVHQADGSPAAAADITISELNQTILTDQDGHFSLAGLPAGIAESLTLSVVWRNADNIPSFAGATVPIVASGISDAGILMLGPVPQTDTDNDGVPDELELLAGLDPNDPDDGASDRDFDGVVDANEILLGTNPDLFDTDGDGTSDGNEDADNDEVSNKNEFTLGLNPFDVDSDADGIADGDEVENGTDPSDAASSPPRRVVSAGVSFHNLFDQPGLTSEVVRFSAPVSFLNAPAGGRTETPVSQILIFQNLAADSQIRTPVTRPVRFQNTPAGGARTPVSPPIIFDNQ